MKYIKLIRFEFLDVWNLLIKSREARSSENSKPVWFKHIIFIKVSLFFSFYTFAQPFCVLQPENYDEQSMESIHTFEDNIESKISSIYQQEYPHLKEKTQEVRFFTKNLKKLEEQLFRKYVKRPHRHHRVSQISHSRIYKRKLQFLHFLDQDLQSEEEFNAVARAFFTKKSFTFDVYRESVSNRKQLQDLINEINSEIEPMQRPHFLYPPKVNFSIRNNDIYYGDIQMEGFFTPPKDNLLKIPFINIGFETNENTIIYTCIHLDAYDKSKNAVYIYFLNATKFNVVSLKDIVTNFDLVIRHFLTFYREPEVIIAPVPITEDPAGSIITPVTKVVNAMSFLKPLKVVNSVISRMQVFTVASRLNPTAQLIMDNVDVGIKGIYIYPTGLKIRYAASTLYGLFNFDLITQNQKADFSESMNTLTIEQSDNFIDIQVTEPDQTVEE